MKIYGVYKIPANPNAANKSLKALLARYPTPAIYDGNYLFAETYEQFSGIPAEEVVDIASMGFEGDNGLTKAVLNSMIDDLIASTPRGREIHLSPEQGRYLKETKFKRDEEGIVK